MAPHPGNKVLVVEDELIVRLDLSEAIQLTGRDVVHVSSDDAALDVLEKDNSIGLVFTDIKMAGAIDGIELAHQIRQRWPSIQVVISSGNIATDPRCRDLSAPLMFKPYRLSALREILGACGKA